MNDHLLRCFCLFLFTVIVNNADANNGFADFNYYPYLSDVETDNALTINLASKLPGRFSYFSLTNIRSKDGNGLLEGGLKYYTEQNIRYKLSEDLPLDLTLQMNFRSGESNDRHRLGVRWRMHDTAALRELFSGINLKWSINFHLYQYDQNDADIWQMEHGFRMTFPELFPRLYIAGFIDHTFGEDLPDGFPNHPIVGEAQIGFRLIDDLYLIGEYRINQYRRSDVNNLAVGLEYVLKW